MDANIISLALQILFSTIITIFSILLASKFRNFEWICLVFSFLSNYIFLVLKLLGELQILNLDFIMIYGISLFEILSILIPSFFMIISLIAFSAKK